MDSSVYKSMGFVHLNKFTYLNTFVIQLVHKCSDNGGPTVQGMAKYRRQFRQSLVYLKYWPCAALFGLSALQLCSCRLHGRSNFDFHYLATCMCSFVLMLHFRSSTVIFLMCNGMVVFRCDILAVPITLVLY